VYPCQLLLCAVCSIHQGVAPRNPCLIQQNIKLCSTKGAPVHHTRLLLLLLLCGGIACAAAWCCLLGGLHELCCVAEAAL
jgi:hypothetical protein